MCSLWSYEIRPSELHLCRAQPSVLYPLHQALVVPRLKTPTIHFHQIRQNKTLAPALHQILADNTRDHQLLPCAPFIKICNSSLKFIKAPWCTDLIHIYVSRILHQKSSKSCRPVYPGMGTHVLTTGPIWHHLLPVFMAPYQINTY